NAEGSYTVRFEGLGRKGAGDREGVFTEAYTEAATCQPASWGSDGADLVVEVRCFRDTDGVPANSRFTILVVDGARAGATLAFAHGDQPATGAYAATNSAVRPTGSVQVNRNDTGLYSVAFTGFYRTGDLKETVLVTATGETPGRCLVNSWSNSDDIGDATD